MIGKKKANAYVTVVKQQKIKAKPHTFGSRPGRKNLTKEKGSGLVSARSASILAMTKATSRWFRKPQHFSGWSSGNGTRKKYPAIATIVVSCNPSQYPGMGGKDGHAQCLP